jgi:hypothetical protein
MVVGTSAEETLQPRDELARLLDAVAAHADQIDRFRAQSLMFFESAVVIGQPSPPNRPSAFDWTEARTGREQPAAGDLELCDRHVSAPDRELLGGRGDSRA